MFDLISRYGLGFKPSSYHEIRVKYLKEEVTNTSLALQSHRDEWKKMGYTIMNDGWTDKKRRAIINFLVNNPKETVFLKSIDASVISKTAKKVFEMMDNIVEEEGKDNVIKVITNNAINYKVIGQMLMTKRKKLFWTPCVAHCVDLMLEDYEKKISIHEKTLRCLHENKGALIRMFTSDDWKSSKFAKTNMEK